jgi:hypothetical protein
LRTGNATIDRGSLPQCGEGDLVRSGQGHTGSDGRFWRIVLKKSFFGDERNFLEPLMRFTRGDVRDHIDLSKIDHGPS